MLEANPGVDPFLPQSGTRLVKVPQQLISSRYGSQRHRGERGGNAPYYYPPGNTVEVFPIGIRRAGARNAATG